MPEFRAKLYRVALVHWVDLPKKAVDALKLPRADIKGGGLGLNALLRFNDDLDRVTLLPGTEADVAIPLPKVPTAGTAATLVVRVEPVGGEKNTDNNQGTYTVLFAN